MGVFDPKRVSTQEHLDIEEIKDDLVILKNGKVSVVKDWRMVPDVFLILKITFGHTSPDPQIDLVFEIVFTLANHAEKLYTEPGQRLLTCW